MSTSFRKVVEARQEKLDYGRLLQILDEVSPQPSADEVYSVLNDLSLKTSSVHLTPQKAAKLMADIGRLYGPNKVLDLACGTGQLLFLCDYASQRYGADIDADAIALAQRLQPDMPFNVVDSTRLAEDKKYDMVISALPFGMRARVDGRSLPIERALLEKALALLEDKGVLIALIPPNVLFARVYESFRERVMHGFALDAIINLPGAFLKYTSLESHLIVIRNGKPRKTTYLADYEQAGSQLLTNLQDGTGEFQIPLKRFENRWVRNYYNPKYDVIETRLEGVAVRTIGEIADVTRGIHVRREEKQAKGRYFVLAPRDFRDGQLTVDEGRSNRYIGDLEERHFDRAILNPGDIVVGLIFDPAMYVFKKDDPPAVAGSNVAIIRSNDNEYIGTYLSSNEGRKLFLLQTAQRMTRATISHLSMADLRQIRIPILPVSDLNALSETEIVDAPTDKLVELRDELEHLKMNLGAQPGFKQSTKPESEFDRLREPMIAYSPEPEPRVTIEDVEENLASSLFSFLESRLSAI